jgi:hypothetical protein
MKKIKCLAVVCRYNEDLVWTRVLSIPVVIYNKGEKLEEMYSSIEVENEGRESEAYLRFIVENYETLPQRLVFLQGNPSAYFGNILTYLKTPNKNDICFLSDFNPVCDAIGRPHHFEELPLKEILRELKMDDSMESFHFGAGAQYLVPRKYILNKSLEWWKNAYEVHKNNKTAPWSFERLWPLIWNHKTI